jgi:hypothetical protein
MLENRRGNIRDRNRLGYNLVVPVAARRALERQRVIWSLRWANEEVLAPRV